MNFKLYFFKTLTGFRNVRLTNEYSEELELSSVLLKVAITKERTNEQEKDT